MLLVAPRIVNSVSCVKRIQHEIHFSWQAQYLVNKWMIWGVKTPYVWFNTHIPLPRSMRFDVLRSASQHRQPIRGLLLAYRLRLRIGFQSLKMIRIWYKLGKVNKGPSSNIQQIVIILYIY